RLTQVRDAQAISAYASILSFYQISLGFFSRRCGTAPCSLRARLRRTGRPNPSQPAIVLTTAGPPKQLKARPTASKTMPVELSASAKVFYLNYFFNLTKINCAQ